MIARDVVRELQPPLQLGLQEVIFGGQIFDKSSWSTIPLTKARTRAVLAIGRGRRLRRSAQEVSRQQGYWRHYDGEFVREPFRQHGISYECKQPKSDLFSDMLPLLNSGNITLPRHDRLIAQIVGLERRVSRAGRDSIDHVPGAHDDIANAVSGVVGAIASGIGSAWMNFIWD